MSVNEPVGPAPRFPARDEDYDRRIRVWPSDDPIVKLWDEAEMIVELHAPSGTGGEHTEAINAFVRRVTDDMNVRRVAAFRAWHDAEEPKP